MFNCCDCRADESAKRTRQNNVNMCALHANASVYKIHVLGKILCSSQNRRCTRIHKPHATTHAPRIWLQMHMHTCTCTCIHVYCLWKFGPRSIVTSRYNIPRTYRSRNTNAFFGQGISRSLGPRWVNRGSPIFGGHPRSRFRV
jgi:hypothetical protein